MSVLSRENQTKKRVNRIIHDYAESVDLLNELFSLVYHERCEPCIETLDSCCDTAGPSCIGDGLYGPARIEIDRRRAILRDKAREKGKDMGTSRDGEHCLYLAMGEGCILGNLKPAYCAAFADCEHGLVSHFNKEYDVDYDEFAIHKILGTILSDRPQAGSEVYAESHNQRLEPEVVQNFKAHLQAMIDRVSEIQARN